MPNQQLVEAEVCIFDYFYFECTELETNTIRDNDVDHLLSIDSSLFDPTSKIRIDIYYNDLYKYPKLKLRGTAIRFLGYEKKTGENGNEERRKGSSFSRWDPTLSKFTAGFNLRFTKKS